MDDAKQDRTKDRPQEDRLVSQGNDRRAAEAGGLPQGFDAAESGVGDAVPFVPDGDMAADGAGDAADTGAEVTRAA